MKKLIFSLIIVSFFGVTGFAQQSQGTISVGGSFKLQSQTVKYENGNASSTGDKTTGFTLLPSVEYFLMQDLSAGIGIGYDMTKVKHTNGSTETNGMFLLNPYVRKYFGLGDKVYFFGEGSVLLGFGNNTTEANGNSVKYSASHFQLGITPGIRYNLTNRISLDGTFGFIGYDRQSQDTGTQTSTAYNTVLFNLDLTSVSFGFRVAF